MLIVVSINHFLWLSYNTGDTKEEALGEEYSKARETPWDAADYDAPKEPLGADRTGQLTEVRVFPPDPDPMPTMMGHPEFIGSYTPVSVDQNSVGGGFDEMISEGMHRSLQFHAGSAAVPRSVVQMWGLHGDWKTNYETEWVSGNDPSNGLSARFVEKIDGKVTYTVNSYMVHIENYFGNDNYLIEKVSGHKNVSTPGAELLPSGKQTLFANRVHWAKPTSAKHA